jgi:hypothetical protein
MRREIPCILLEQLEIILALLLDRFGEFAQNQIPIVGSKAGGTVFSSG